MGLGFYTVGWARSRVHRCWTRLGSVGSSLGRHRALSLGVRSVASVAGWLGHEACGFRAVAGEVVHSVVSSVRRGVGQGWHCVGGSVSCKRACGARLGDARVHGNGTHALGALGGSMASGWHSRVRCTVGLGQGGSWNCSRG
jgi:hypothetical protein